MNSTCTFCVALRLYFLFGLLAVVVLASTGCALVTVEHNTKVIVVDPQVAVDAVNQYPPTRREEEKSK